jgi:hypothetical protein
VPGLRSDESGSWTSLPFSLPQLDGFDDLAINEQNATIKDPGPCDTVRSTPEIIGFPGIIKLFSLCPNSPNSRLFSCLLHELLASETITHKNLKKLTTMMLHGGDDYQTMFKSRGKCEFSKVLSLFLSAFPTELRDSVVILFSVDVSAPHTCRPIHHSPIYHSRRNEVPCTIINLILIQDESDVIDLTVIARCHDITSKFRMQTHPKSTYIATHSKKRTALLRDAHLPTDHNLYTDLPNSESDGDVSERQ